MSAKVLSLLITDRITHAFKYLLSFYACLKHHLWFHDDNISLKYNAIFQNSEFGILRRSENDGSFDWINLNSYGYMKYIDINPIKSTSMTVYINKMSVICLFG